MPRNCDVNAAVVRQQLALNGLFDFIFNLFELQLLGIRIHEIGQRMFADDGALGAAQHAFEHRLGGWHGAAGEFPQKLSGIGNLPADIDAGQQGDAVRSVIFAEFVLEILNALVEFVNLLDRPWPFQIRAGLVVRAGRLAERGDHGDLGLAHLKDEKQQRENNDQRCADDDG